MSILGKILLYASLYVLAPAILVFLVFGLLCVLFVFLSIWHSARERREEREEAEREALERKWEREAEEAMERVNHYRGPPSSPGALDAYYADGEERDGWDIDVSPESDDTCPFCGGTGYAVDDIGVADGSPAAGGALCPPCGGTGRL